MCLRIAQLKIYPEYKYPHAWENWLLLTQREVLASKGVMILIPTTNSKCKNSSYCVKEHK